VQSLHDLSQAQILNGPLKYYNSTLNYDELTHIHETTPGNKYRERLGIIVSGSSSSDVHVYGVKADQGTSDAFLVLPLTVNSKEFFIAAWKYVLLY